MSSSRNPRRRLRGTAIGLAYRTENGIRDWFARLARDLGWTPAVIPYPGYASGTSACVLGRLVLAPRSVDPSDTQGVRGWRLLFTLESPGTEVEIALGGTTMTATSDDAGIVDARMALGDPLPPGTAHAQMMVPRREAVSAPVHVVSTQPLRGVICDIDDTAWVTGIAHPVRAAWRTLRGTSDSRQSVPGMARLLSAAVQGQQYPPVVYVSNGPWNFVSPVTRFLAKHDFPAGAVLMTDWGITPTRWFRDGKEHKRSSIARLMQDLPRTEWVLVGDDGEHDPDIYAAAVAAHPERVAAIALRTVGPHREGLDVAQVDGVPVLRGDHGDELLPLLREALAHTRPASDASAGDQ